MQKVLLEKEKDSTEADSSSVVGSKENGESKEESSGGAGWVLWLAIGLLGLLIILSLVAIVTNKKKVIYLKPKNKLSYILLYINPFIVETNLICVHSIHGETLAGI